MRRGQSVGTIRAVADAATVRVARPADAAGIGLVHVRSWQAAYRGHFPQDFLDNLDPVQRGEGWRRQLDLGLGPDQVLLVSEIATKVVGFVNAGPCRDEDADGRGEIYALYVLPELWGRGLGRELMAAALDALAGLGFEEVTLWVLEGNHRARRFYEAGGWSVDGATKTDNRPGFPVPEVRYRRRRA